MLNQGRFGRITSFGVSIGNAGASQATQGTIMCGAFPAPEFVFPVTDAGSNATWSDVLSFIGLPTPGASQEYIPTSIMNAGKNVNIPANTLNSRSLRWCSTITNSSDCSTFKNLQNNTLVNSASNTSMGLVFTSLATNATVLSQYLTTAIASSGQSAVSLSGSAVLAVPSAVISMAVGTNIVTTATVGFGAGMYLGPSSLTFSSIVGGSASAYTLGQIVIINTGSNLNTYYATGPQAGLPAYISATATSVTVNMYAGHSPAYTSPSGMYLSSDDVDSYFSSYSYGQVYIVQNPNTGLITFNVPIQTAIPSGTTLSFAPPAPSTNIVVDPSFLSSSGWEMLAIRGSNFTSTTGITITQFMALELVPPVPVSSGMYNGSTSGPVDTGFLNSILDIASKTDPFTISEM